MVQINRKTKETDIIASMELLLGGKTDIDTGVGFFDHMLEAFAKHSYMHLEIKCEGDTHVDDHHTVEDVGIVIGQLLHKTLYPIESIERYGNASVVMDEACVSCDLDISNRGFLVFDMPIDGKVGQFDVELVEEFFRAVAFNASITIHLVCQRGKNRHHIIEAAFKALAVALRRATTHNKRAGIPSTKGIL